MQDHVAEIDQNPTFMCIALNTTLQTIVSFYDTHRGVRECIQHPIAGARTDNKIFCKYRLSLYIKDNDIFPFSLFQCIYNCS